MLRAKRKNSPRATPQTGKTTIKTDAFAPFADSVRQAFEPRFKQMLSDRSAEDRLQSAIEYSALSGGKRLRPLLVVAASQAVGCNTDSPFASAMWTCAAAAECIHAYSLIHDDLPAMDDDDLRRGKPTSHIQFDEATAILAGDALHCLAFELVSANEHPNTAAMIRTLARAAGAAGMVGGQAIDIASVGKALSLDELRTMHSLKTGALISASVELGALVGNADDDSVLALQDYGRAVGLAFQVADDILDIEASTEQLGKTQGSDLAKDKPTFPALMGLDASKAFAQSLHEQALLALTGFGKAAEPLRQLSSYAIGRDH